MKMDYKSRYSNPNPKLTANILSKFTFSWLIPLFWYGRKNDLEAKDTYDVLPENESEHLTEKLERCWRQEVENAEKSQCKPSLFKAVAKTYFWSTLSYSTVFTVAHILPRLVHPLAIDYYVKYFETKASPWHGFYSASVVVLIPFTANFALAHIQFKLLELGMRAKIACSGLIYQKMNRLSCTAMTQIDEGHVINLLSNDVLKWEDFFLFVHFSWIIPMQCVGAAYIMAGKIESSSILGILTIILHVLPVQGLFAWIISKARLTASVAADRRILLITEIFNGIKVIKMYNWEKAFEKFVLSARKREINWLKLLAYLNGISLNMYAVTSNNALFVTSLAYYFIKGRLMASESIFSIWRYLIMLKAICYYVSFTVTSISEIRIAIKRMEVVFYIFKFLLLEEIKNTIQYHPMEDDHKECISVQEVSAMFDTKHHTDNDNGILSNTNIKFFQKKLYIITGPTGAGKSSLLKLILGELQPSAGSVSINGKISYSSQEPWLFSGSVKSNILFGEPYDEIRYKNVVNACALSEDFNQLPYSDKTLVGDGGSILSGGQKARINLARALYRKADIYLLDDCLSAVDVSVGKVLYEKCLKGILKEKTIILVTQNMLHAVEQDQIIFMKEGTINYQGPLSNLERNNQYSLYLASQKNSTSENKIILKQKMSAKTEDSNEKLRNNEEKEDKEPNETDEFITHTSEPRESEELMVKGKIAVNLYWKYFKAGGSYWKLFTIAFTAILAQAFLCLTDLHVKHIATMSSAKYNVQINETKIPSSTNILENSNSAINRALCVYGFLIAGSIIFISARSFLFISVCMNASEKIHNKMFVRLLRAPLSFFYGINIGRLINRFSQDTGAVDDRFAEMLTRFGHCVVYCFSILLMICILKWWILFPAIFAIIVLIKIQHIYQSTARDVRRLEGVAKGPVFSLVNSSFTGLLTIRSCQSENLVYDEFTRLQNEHTSAYYFVLAGKIIAKAATEICNNFFIALITYGFLFTNNSSSTINFVYVQVSHILSIATFIMKYWADILTNMVNIERMMQFTEVEQEIPPEDYPVKTPITSWPSQGCIQIDHLSLKYSETTKTVLKDLNFNIEAGQRIGIVGRTGAGKSSLIAALFRLVDFDGSIYIDDVNIKKLGIPDVRSKISIIPQDCLLFTISLRDNIDPNSEYSDEVIWSALKDVGLGSMYNSLSVLIDKKQLSKGQMQLLSLARVILKKNKILVLDEATANVDNETDATVLNILKNKFKDCTIIYIAHRLYTIIDSDKVLVMNNGQILEFDNPYALLRKDGGIFRTMALQSSDTDYKNLKKIARDVWIKKQK